LVQHSLAPKYDPTASAAASDGPSVWPSGVEAIPVLVVHALGCKRYGIGLNYLPKNVDLALKLFSLCHFVALTGERAASFLASDAAFPCPGPCVFVVPAPTLVRPSRPDCSTSQMICCRSSLSSCSISQSALDRLANVDPEVALRLCLGFRSQQPRHLHRLPGRSAVMVEHQPPSTSSLVVARAAP
jgi:hypothetical protein